MNRTMLCFRCRHTWVKRRRTVVRCPRCNSRYWHSPRPPRRGRPPRQKQEKEEQS